MNSTPSNGLHLSTGRSPRFKNASSSAIQLPQFSSSGQSRDHVFLAFLAHRKAQRRRAAAAAQAAAGRRAVIAVALALLGMVGGAVVLVREAQLQAQEVRRG